jgi:hypothetical protein
MTSGNSPDTAEKRSLCLVLPGLVAVAAVESEAGSPPAALERLLGRADPVGEAGADSTEACLFELFGAEVDSSRDLPVAAVTRVHDMGVLDNSWWMRADPVHLLPHQDGLLLPDRGRLQLSQEEADSLVGEIMTVFADDGWVLKAPSPERWYLKPRDVPDIRTTPITSVVGSDIRPYLPAGPEGSRWHTVMNEVQILLHTAQVNVDREARDLPTVNSLWFWGGGRLPTFRQPDWTCLWSNEVVSTSLARLTELAVVPRPATASQWLTQAPAGKHLLVLDQGMEALLSGRVERWRDFLDTLEPDWIGPLESALRTNELSELLIYTDRCQGFRLTGKHLRRWWRRKVRLENLVPNPG